MSVIDWSIIGAYPLDHLGRHPADQEVERAGGYLLASRSLPWWAVGLSVMATQLSAITMIGTTGQGYAEGMQFLQFYFALPIAMIVLSLTLVRSSTTPASSPPTSTWSGASTPRCAR